MVLLFFSTWVLATIRKSQIGYAFHQTSRGVSQEFTPWLQRAINTDMVFRGHEKVRGLWRMM